MRSKENLIKKKEEGLYKEIDELKQQLMKELGQVKHQTETVKSVELAVQQRELVLE